MVSRPGMHVQAGRASRFSLPQHNQRAHTCPALHRQCALPHGREVPVQGARQRLRVRRLHRAVHGKQQLIRLPPGHFRKEAHRIAVSGPRPRRRPFIKRPGHVRPAQPVKQHICPLLPAVFFEQLRQPGGIVRLKRRVFALEPARAQPVAKARQIVRQRPDRLRKVHRAQLCANRLRQRPRRPLVPREEQLRHAARAFAPGPANDRPRAHLSAFPHDQPPFARPPFRPRPEKTQASQQAVCADYVHHRLLISSPSLSTSSRYTSRSDGL